MIAITGATGFVGGRLLKRLIDGKERVRVLGRRRPPGAEGVSDNEYFRWEGSAAPAPVQAFENCHAVVHLAGEPIAQRWNAEVKQKIRSSRSEGTRSVVQAMTAASSPPGTLICASAVGYYGDRGEEILTETSAPGRGFIPEVCVEWESAAREAGQAGVRVVALRFGIILGPHGGALQKMLTPFRLGLGGPLGSGRQWMPWIHIDDVLEMILFAMRTAHVSGPVNTVAPQIVQNIEFTKALGRAVNRPAIIPAPRFGLKLVFGEMADTMFASLRVVPDAATAAGFRFRYKDLDTALRAIIREG
jgi:uncharacterized protein